jgi:hypothetical protein
MVILSPAVQGSTGGLEGQIQTKLLYEPGIAIDEAAQAQGAGARRRRAAGDLVGRGYLGQHAPADPLK